MATKLLRAQIDSARALAAETILKNLGLKPADAINMLYAQIVSHRGLPFAVHETGYAYAASEYGLTEPEVDVAEERIGRSVKRARKSGSVHSVPSDFDQFRKQIET